jgi:hypothetical protein
VGSSWSSWSGRGPGTEAPATSDPAAEFRLRQPTLAILHPLQAERS